MIVGGAQAVRRAVAVMRTVAQLQRTGASLVRVAKATGFSTPTTYRLLKTLTEERLLSFDAVSRSYFVGPLSSELGLAATPGNRPDAQWQDAVCAVARQTRLTSYLMVRSDDEAVCLFCAEGSAASPTRLVEVGQRVPLGIGAGSLAILSSLDDAEIAQILAAHETRFGVFAGGIQDLDHILERVSETRDRGYSMSAGTIASGAIGIGVLVPPGPGITRAAITVSALASSFEAAEGAKFAKTIRRVIAQSVERSG